jgi:hypothetical protein
MERIAINVGQVMCEAVTTLSGTAKTSCYNSLHTQLIGYGTLIGLLLLILFRKFFSPTGGA